MRFLSTRTGTLGTSQSDISTYAARIITIKIPLEKIRDVIGSGKTIRTSSRSRA